MSKRKAIDWAMEISLIKKEKEKLREWIYNDVMCLVPLEVWVIIVQKCYPKLPRCLLAEEKEKFTRFLIKSLSFVSKTLCDAVKIGVSELFLSTDSLPRLQISMYPNIKRLILKNRHFQCAIDLPVTKELKELVFLGRTHI